MWNCHVVRIADCSAFELLANALSDDGREGTVARAALAEAGDSTAPDLVDVETVSAVHQRWLASRMTTDRFEIAVRDVSWLDFVAA